MADLLEQSLDRYLVEGLGKVQVDDVEPGPPISYCRGFFQKLEQVGDTGSVFLESMLAVFDELVLRQVQCCGSGSGIRDWVLFDPWIRDPE